MKTGQRFPVELEVHTTKGPAPLDDLLGDGPAVIAFHRLWCPFCQQAARDLAAAGPRIEALSGRVVIVYREDAQTAHSSCAQRGLDVTCVSDPDHTLEAAADVAAMTVQRYLAFSPRRLFTALREGSRPGKMTTSILQGRGTFVLDARRRVAYAHTAVHAADVPAIDDVMSALSRVATQRP